MNPLPLRFFSAGTRCDADLWLPAGPARAVPGVVLCHGFRGVRAWLLPAVARAFADAGVAALTFDYRGFGSSAGSRGRLVPAEQVEDVRNAVTLLASRPEVDDGSIGLFGTSFGGGTALAAAALDDRVAVVVAQVPIGDVRRAWWEPMEPRRREHLAAALDADRTRRVLTGVSDTIDPQELLDNPQSRAAFDAAVEEFPQLRTRFPLEAVERILEFSPESTIHRIAPRGVLVIGAEHDLAVPPTESQLLHDAAGCPKQLHVWPITHYDIYRSPWRERAVDLAVAFLTTHATGRAA